MASREGVCGVAVADDGVRVRSPKRRRQEVLDAAARVFHERGYESSSIQDIAEDLGILKGSLYYYIRSKEDLLDEILWDVHEKALANIQRLDEMEGDTLQKIRAFVTLHIVFNLENLVTMGVFYHDFRSLGDERRARIVQARDIYDGMLRDLINVGQTEGLVCPDVDPKLGAMAILGMSNWVYHWYKPRGRLKPAEVADDFADLVLAGLACDKASHRKGHRSKLGALPADFRTATTPSTAGRRKAPKRPKRPA